jgi:rSAM/selenodomain-associated transferase 1
MVRVLIVMTKAPLPGYSKSRLVDVLPGSAAARLHLADGHAQALGPFDAARVARLADAFVRDTLEVSRQSAHDALWIVFGPPESEPYFRVVAPGATLVPESGGNLGERLTAAVALAFARGATRVIVIGSDSPHVPPARIDAGFEALSTADCVLGPAHDGGYYLIGLAAARPELFRGITWGTASVLAETRAVAAAEGLRVGLLPVERDIDERADLEWLAEELRTAPARCPRTFAVLGEGAS